MDAKERKNVFKALVGSRAYGTNVEGSDYDYKGVYVATEREVLTGTAQDQYSNSKDETYYEVRRFLELLATGNPTMIELLFTPEDCIVEKDPIYDVILKHRDKFLTTKLANSFAGYAFAQIVKAKGLNKKMNWEAKEMTRKTPLDFCHFVNVNGTKPLTVFLDKLGIPQELCGLTKLDNFRDGYSLWADTNHWSRPAKHQPVGLKGIILPDSNDVRVTTLPENPNTVLDYLGVVSYNKDGYTQHCNRYREYETWLKERNEQRYVDSKTHGQKIDGKNLLHCMRLIEMGLEIAQGKGCIVRRPNAAELIKIRKGDVDLQQLLDAATNKIEEVKEAFKTSRLPDSVPNSLIEDILFEIRTTIYDKSKK